MAQPPVTCPECRHLASGVEVVRRGPWALHARLDPGGVPGWLVLAPWRHVEQIDQLDDAEQRALGPLLSETAAALRAATGAPRIYTALFAEQLRHLHVHVVARPADWPEEQWGARLLVAGPPVDAVRARQVCAPALARLRPPERRSRRQHRALLLSALVCPGLGQLANGHWLKGLLMLAGALAGTVGLAAFVTRRLLAALQSPLGDADPLAVIEALGATWPAVQGPFSLGLAALALLWAWSAWDAYRHGR